jgi:hypothetical protein
MKKIIIAFDGNHFSNGAMEFARQLNEREPILLAGIFVPQATYTNLWSYSGAMVGGFVVPVAEQDDRELTERTIERFRHYCIHNGIPFRVHEDFSDFALPELTKETRFADLMIISSETFFEDLSNPQPGEYMKEILHETECPVIVIPEAFEFPGRNIIAYDGSASSAYSMKQFAYLFPDLAKNDTLLVYSRNEANKKIPYQSSIEELATQHFKNLSIMKLELNAAKYFKDWLRGSEDNVMLICGAFGRSTISQMFKKSFVTDIIADHKLPVFIAHR